MPSIGRQAVTSARGFGAFTVLSGPFWIGTITKTSTTFLTRSVTVDSLGNVIVTGNILGSGGSAQVIKINSSGTLLWQKTLATAGTGDVVMDCACLNIPGGGYDWIYVITTNTSGDNILFRVESDGTLTYQKYYGGGVYGIRLNSIPSDQVLVVGQYQVSTYLEGIHLVYTLPNGTLFYQNKISDATKDITLTGASNPYPGGSYVVVGQAGTALLLVSPVGNGNLNWQKQLNPSGSESTTWADVVVGSPSTTAYVVVSATSALLIAKYDSISTGGATLAWQRQFAVTVTSRFRIARDSANNVYCVGMVSGSTAFICKYSSSGALIWQRSISNVNVYDICVYNDAMYITGQVIISGNTSIIVFKLPITGGLLGTYSIGGASVTYAATSYTEGAGTWTESTPSYTNSTISQGNGTSSNTYSNGANTLTVTNI